MAITVIGVQPVISTVGQGAGTQTYKVGAVTSDGEELSTEVTCTNDLSVAGNFNVVHWSGEGDSFRVYKAVDGVFGLVSTDASPFIDNNIAPDTGQQPPGA